jgi:hypothetical protein
VIKNIGDTIWLPGTNLYTSATKRYTIEVTNDVAAWQSAVSGELDATADRISVKWTSAQDVRYVRFTINTHYGEQGGGLGYFAVFGSNAQTPPPPPRMPVMVELTGSDNIFADVDVGFSASPAFVDLDGDSIDEILVGRSDAPPLLDSYYEFETGCVDKTREGFRSWGAKYLPSGSWVSRWYAQTEYQDIAACGYSSTLTRHSEKNLHSQQSSVQDFGMVDSLGAQALCESGWHVCKGGDSNDKETLKKVSYHAMSGHPDFEGKFIYDAALNCGKCYSSCQEAYSQSVSDRDGCIAKPGGTQNQPQAGCMGYRCRRENPSNGVCTQTGRNYFQTEYKEEQCRYGRNTAGGNEGPAGVVCCRDKAVSTWRSKDSHSKTAFVVGTAEHSLTGRKQFNEMFNKNNGEHFSGDVGEIISFSRALSDEEQAAVEAYLYSKWVDNSKSRVIFTLLLCHLDKCHVNLLYSQL